VIKFTERDRALLRFVGEQYTLRLDQLERLMSRPQTTARQWMTRMRAAGWLKFAPLLAGQTTYLWLTPAGMRQVYLAYTGWEPLPGRLEHLYWITHMRLWLQTWHPQYYWTCEREMQYQLRQEGQRSRAVHIPDALLTNARGDLIALEVELRPKSLARTVQIMELLLEDYPASWYYVGPAAHRTVVAAKAEMPAHQQQRISVELLPTGSP
jgi:hypothetical protein